LKKKIGIIGGSSFLGNSLINELHKNNFKIIQTFNKKKIYYDFCQNRYLNLNDKIISKNLDKYFATVNCLIYLSAVYPVARVDFESLNVNYLSVTKVADWCLKKKIKFIFLSTFSVYQLNKKKKQSEKDIIKKDLAGGLYAFQKYLSENYILNLGTKGLKFLILRPSSIYGPNQKSDTLISRIFSNIKKNKNVLIYKPLSVKFNIIHVDDVSRAVIHLLKMKLQGIYNIGNYKSVSLKDMHIIMKKLKINAIVKKSKKNNSEFIRNFINIDLSKLKKTKFKTIFSVQGHISNIINPNAK
jgi:nucleoside-diphosphate-sugar epimerase